MGRAFSFREPVTGRLVMLGSAAAIALLLVVPFPRNDVDATAVVTTERLGNDEVRVAVEVSPPLGDTDWAEVLAWQGGHMDAIPLRETGPGTYESTAPAPTGGEWKTLVRFASKDVLVAAPVFMPKDPAIGASEVPVEPRREVNLTRDTELLLREATEGPGWPAAVSYGGIALVALMWLSALSIAFVRISNGSRLGSNQAEGRSVKTRRAPSVA